MAQLSTTISQAQRATAFHFEEKRGETMHFSCNGTDSLGFQVSAPATNSLAIGIIQERMFLDYIGTTSEDNSKLYVCFLVHPKMEYMNMGFFNFLSVV